MKYENTFLIPSRMHDLRRRYEKPNADNRWDKPLFFVDMTPSSHQHAPPPLDSPSSPSESTPSLDAPVFVPQPTTVFSSWKKSKAVPPADGLPLNTPPGSVTTLPADPDHLHLSSLSVTRATAPHTPSAPEPDGQGVYFSGSKVVDVDTGVSPQTHAESSSPDHVIPDVLLYLQTAIAPPPTLATKQIKHAGADLLYQLDRVSQSIAALIMAHQQEHRDGTPLVLRDFKNCSVTLPRYLSAPELQRIRRQFVKMNSQHPPDTSVDVGSKFIEFLMTQL
jgi:hypothetical protein